MFSSRFTSGTCWCVDCHTVTVVNFVPTTMNKAAFLSILISVAASSRAATISRISCEIGYYNWATGISADYRMQGPSTCAVTDDIGGSTTANIGLTTSLLSDPAPTFSTVSATLTDHARSVPYAPSFNIRSSANATGDLQFSADLTTLETGNGYLAVKIPMYYWGADVNGGTWGTFGFSVGEMFSFTCVGADGQYLSCSVNPFSRSTWPVERWGTEIMVPVTLGQTFRYSIFGTINSGGTSQFGGGEGVGYLSPQFSFYAADGATPVLMQQVPEPATSWTFGLGIITYLIIIARKTLGNGHRRIKHEFPHQ